MLRGDFALFRKALLPASATSSLTHRECNPENALCACYANDLFVIKFASIPLCAERFLRRLSFASNPSSLYRVACKSFHSMARMI